MPLAPGLLVRTLVRPGGRVTTVVVRRRDPAKPPPARRPDRTLREEPSPPDRVPAGTISGVAGFTPPVSRAIAVLGGRARPLDGDGVALDGRRAALALVVAEANRCLLAAGRAPIPYPGVSSVGARP